MGLFSQSTFLLLSIESQIRMLKAGVHIIVATP